MSRSFLCTLAGITITIFAWFSPWVWPAWPALTVLDLAFTPERPFAALGPWTKALVIVGLIALNVAFWSGVFYMTRSVIGPMSRTGRTSRTGQIR